MDLVAGAVGDAAHRDVLARAAKAAGAVALDVGKVDHEVGVVDEAGDVYVVEGLEVDLLGVEVLAQVAAVVQHGAAHQPLGVAALLGVALVDVVVGDEAVAACVVDEVHQLAHKDRRDGGVGDARTHVHLDGDGLAGDLLGQAALFEQAVELGGERLAGLVARKGHGGEEYLGCHVKQSSSYVITFRV